MKIELLDVVSLSKKIEGESTGAHYLLGYLWANLSDEQQNEIYNTFQKKAGN
jgi:hypothetical protein